MSQTLRREVWVGIAALGLLAIYLAVRHVPNSPAPGVPSPAPSPKPPTEPKPEQPPSPQASVVDEPIADNLVPPGELPRYRGPVRDAKTAALLREALIARKAQELSAGQGEPSAVKGSAMPKAVGAGNQAEKPLGDYIARVMRDQFVPLASECYETLLASRPSAAGNVALEFSVLGDPSVGGVVVDVSLGSETTLVDAAFRECMTESMYSVVFDAPPNEGGNVSVKQSFELSP